jgi:N-glycosylase/DNA lyase
MARTNPFISHEEEETGTLPPRECAEMSNPTQEICKVWTEPLKVERRSPTSIEELIEAHNELKDPIGRRLAEFRGRWLEGNEVVFPEMCFCLLTPQSSAMRGLKAVCKLESEDLLINGDMKDVEKVLSAGGVRFADSKARYILRNRHVFIERSSRPVSEALGFNRLSLRAVRKRVREGVLGFGFKEATHFLRNLGISLESGMAILDRHIQRALVRFGYLEEVPRNLSRERNYARCEMAMQEMSKDSGIHMDELDLLLWANRTGMILK